MISGLTDEAATGSIRARSAFVAAGRQHSSRSTARFTVTIGCCGSSSKSRRLNTVASSRARSRSRDSLTIAWSLRAVAIASSATSAIPSRKYASQPSQSPSVRTAPRRL